MTCGRDNHAGTVARTDFNAVIQGITQTDNAVLWLKMVPIARDTIANGVNGAIFCPPWTGAADGNLPMYKQVIAQVKNAGYLGPLVIESNNEMEFACYKYWQSQGAPISGGGSVGVSKRIGEHYAATMPALKAYARGLGFSDLVVGGYIGVGGGTEWGQACTRDSSQVFGYACGYSTRWVREFNVAVQPGLHPRLRGDSCLQSLAGLLISGRLRVRRPDRLFVLPELAHQEPCSPEQCLAHRYRCKHTFLAVRVERRLLEYNRQLDRLDHPRST
jgi:hypothetical protein